MSRVYVRCSSCGDEHYGEAVEFINVEEDYQGRDLLIYICPVTGQETTAYCLREG